MRKISRCQRGALGIVAAACFAAAAVSAADLAPAGYTAEERRGLTYCVALSDTAWAVAERKVHGETVGDVRVEYAKRPRSEVTLPLIDKVYEDQFKTSWDYAVAFFVECAVNVVEIPQVRARAASDCLQRGMIAALANVQKEGGAKKDTVYAYFAKFPAESTHAVIDEVYAKKQERPAAELAAWNACMAPLNRSE